MVLCQRAITVACPWCSETTTPFIKSKKPKRKKVPLSILYCPHLKKCGSTEVSYQMKLLVRRVRSHSLPTKPTCRKREKFICRGTCGGNVDAVIAAIRTLPEDQLLTIHPYALEGYCSKCGGKPSSSASSNGELFEKETEEQEDEGSDSNTNALLRKNSGKFFKRISSADLSLYKKAGELWEKNKDNLPYPNRYSSWL